MDTAAAQDRDAPAKAPKFATFTDQSERNRMTCVSFLKQHRLKLHLTNPIERPNCEIERRKEVVGILTDEVQVGLPEVAG